VTQYLAGRAADLLREEALPGVRLPWPGDARELRQYVIWLLRLPRSRWPDDPAPVATTARALALAVRRLEGGSIGVTEATARRVVFEVATSYHQGSHTGALWLAPEV
jgi:hypothetical protein